MSLNWTDAKMKELLCPIVRISRQITGTVVIFSAQLYKDQWHHRVFQTKSLKSIACVIADVVNLQCLGFMWEKQAPGSCMKMVLLPLGFDWLDFVISCMLTMRVTLWQGGIMGEMVQTPQKAHFHEDSQKWVSSLLVFPFLVLFRQPWPCHRALTGRQTDGRPRALCNLT